MPAPLPRPLSAAGQSGPSETTLELVEVIRSAMPGQGPRKSSTQAKGAFQAIRIAVNDEAQLGGPDASERCALGSRSPVGGWR